MATAGIEYIFRLVYALFGLALLAGFTVFDQIWIIIAAGIGFPLVAPFLTAGLYEMSWRFRRGDTFTVSYIFLVIFRQQRRELGWVSFVVLFVFWIWAYQFRLILALTVQSHGYRSFDHLLTTIFTTGEGMAFLTVGTLVGGVLATVLYCITVMAMPLLLDKNVDCVTAMIASVQTVLKSTGGDAGMGCDYWRSDIAFGRAWVHRVPGLRTHQLAFVRATGVRKIGLCPSFQTQSASRLRPIAGPLRHASGRLGWRRCHQARACKRPGRWQRGGRG